MLYFESSGRMWLFIVLSSKIVPFICEVQVYCSRINFLMIAIKVIVWILPWFYGFHLNTLLVVYSWVLRNNWYKRFSILSAMLCSLCSRDALIQGWMFLLNSSLLWKFLFRFSVPRFNHRLDVTLSWHLVHLVIWNLKTTDQFWDKVESNLQEVKQCNSSNLCIK